jgi:uncharacterized membrane protein
MNPYIYVLSVNGLLFFFSVVFYFFPPKKINRFYGYRTNRSMLNEEIWSFSNLQFNTIFVKYAGISFVFALVFASIVRVEISWQPMVLLVLTLAVSVIKTEQTITQNFDEEGKKK